jgi:opacity protein-like surface antigen
MTHFAKSAVVVLSLSLSVAARAQEAVPPLPPEAPPPETKQEPALAPLTLPPPAAPAAKSSSAGSLLLAPKIGVFASTTRLKDAFFLGAEAGFLTPLLDHRLAAILEIDWSRPSAQGAITDPQLSYAGQPVDGSYDLHESQLGILLTAVYRFEDAAPDFTPYGGAGPGLYYHRAAITSFGQTNVESESKLGFQLLAGGEYRLGPGGAFIEAHYHFARVDFANTGRVNAGGFAFAAGYRFRLF